MFLLVSLPKSKLQTLNNLSCSSFQTVDSLKSKTLLGKKD